MAVNVVLKSVFDDRGIKNAMSGFNKIGKSVAKIGAAVGVAFSARAIVNFAGDAIKAAEAAQVANNRLDQIAKSMGIFGTNTTAVTNRLKEFANQQQLVIGQDDELIKSTQAKLLTFKELAATAGQAGGSFDRATKAAFDLAAAGFGSAETNAVQLGKALQDPVKGLTALRRAGVTFTEQEKEQIKTLVESGKTLEAQDAILKAIETQVGGTAAATATASSKMKVAFDEMKESVGQALMPAFEELTKLLMPIVDQLGPLLSEIFVALAPILNTLVSAIQPLIDATEPLKDVFVEIVEVINEALLMIMPVLIDLIKILAPVFTDLVRAILPLVQKLLPPLIKLIEALLPFIQMLADFLVDYVIPGLEKFGNLIADVVIWAVEGLTGALEGLKNMLGPVWDFLKPIIDGLLALAGIDNKKLAKDIKLGATGEDARFARLAASAASSSTSAITNSLTNDTGGGGKSAESQFKKVQKIIKDYQSKLLKAEQEYNDTKLKLNKEYEDTISKLRKEAADEQLGIVQESIDRLRNVFKSATAVGLGDLFGTQTVTEMETQVKKLTDRLTVTVSKETQKTVGGTVSDLISGLSNKLAASRTLLDNASKLASKGFSQTFIEQVVETGTDTGNALATAILGSSTEQQEALKKNFVDLETVSDTGMDALAKSIYDKQGLATRELKNLYTSVQKELDDALLAEQKALQDALAAAGYAFTLNVNGIKTEFEGVIDSLDGKFAGLGKTIDALLAKMAQLSGGAVTDIQKAITAPGVGTQLAGATITADVSAKAIGSAAGIVIDSAADIKGTAAYIQARIAAADKYIKSSSSNASQEAAALKQITAWTSELTSLQQAAKSESGAAGTVVNINVKTDTTQSAAMVGKTIGNVVTKYTTTGGKVLVSGQQ